MAHPMIERDEISTLPSARMSPASPQHLGPPRPSSVRAFQARLMATLRFVNVADYQT
jgi:hypothetical protein